MSNMEKELRKLFQESELFYEAMFCGKMMIGKIDTDIRAKIEFISTHIHKHYDALKVSILNRTDGSVDTSVFRFVDMIGMKNGYEPYFWDDEHCNGWYGFYPSRKDYDIISSTVHDYMSMFADEEMDCEMRM